MPAMAQDANVPTGPVVSPTGQTFNADEANAPTAGEIAEEELAADEQFQNKAAFIESLTEEQHAAFGEILAKHRPELEAIANDLQDAMNQAANNRVFLPGIISDNEQASASAGPSTSAPAAPQGTEPDQRVTQALARTGSVQDAINQELTALLTAEQQALLDKSGFAQTSQAVSANAIQGTDAPQDTNGCYYAALYGYYAWYYAWYAEYYAYYDYYYYYSSSNPYAYYDWYYNYYGKYYADIGQQYAFSAYGRSAIFGDPGSYNDSAAYYFDYNTPGAYYYSYWGSYYGYISYYYFGSYYGYYGYYYGYYAYYYAYYAWLYSYYYC